MRKFRRLGIFGGLVLGVTLLGAGLVQAQGALGPEDFSAAGLSARGEGQTPPRLVAQNAAPQEPKQPPEQVKEQPSPATAPRRMRKSMPETMERQMERRGPSVDAPAKPGTRKFGAQPIRSKETPGD
ncbi:MAG: hypothetical protein M0P73_11500 [Syntrophobacterales bacterium]|jgi:hypothetical protein|nr:hypothetical protein [Syntrophobacterales bacterium]